MMYIYDLFGSSLLCKPYGKTTTQSGLKAATTVVGPFEKALWIGA